MRGSAATSRPELLHLLAALQVLALACGGPEEGVEPRQAEPGAWFTEVGAEMGLDFRHESGIDGSYFMPENIGSGGALFDYDGDGDLDLYLVTSGPRTGAGSSVQAPPNRLFRLESNGLLVDRTDISGVGDRGYGMGAALGDYDGDGDLDLYVTNYGPDALYRNEGNGRFSEVTSAAGIGGEQWSTAACFFEADEDGELDLYVATYVHHFPPKVCTDKAGRPEYCGPAAFRGEADLLYRNRGDGSFADVSDQAGIAASAGRGLGLACVDLDGDQLADIYVANDGEKNDLWINRGGGRFADDSLLLGAAFNAMGKAEASMGVAIGDVDGNLVLDLFLSHLDRETNTLYLNRGAAGFEDATAAARLGPDSLPFTGFGTVLFDADLDGDLDLLIANGKVRRGDDVASPQPAGQRSDGGPLEQFVREYAQPNLFYLNRGNGEFVPASQRAGTLCSRVEVSRGLMTGDLDHDGDLDVVLTQCAGPARIYRNDFRGGGAWLAVRAFDPIPGRDALGALVLVDTGGRRLLQPILSTVGYQTALQPTAHFGLGPLRGKVRVEVLWPGGGRSLYHGVPARRTLIAFRRTRVLG